MELQIEGFTTMSLDELVALGEAEVGENIRKAEEANKRAEAEDAVRRSGFISLLCNLLPEALHPFVGFERWHEPYYDSDWGPSALWTAQALLMIPDLAPIRVYCKTFHLDEPETAKVALHDRHGDQPFEVLEYCCEFNEYDGSFYIAMKSRGATDNILLALANAKRISDHRLAVEEEVDQRNREVANQPPLEEQETVTLPELLVEALNGMIANEVKRQLQAGVE